MTSPATIDATSATSARGRVLAIADDLTGANAIGAAFRRAGGRAVTLNAGHRSRFGDPFWDGFDVVAVNTASRQAPREAATRAVTAALNEWWPAALVSKRIDSTMRGNIGAEVAATIAAHAALSRVRTVAITVPAHPAAGRTTVSGRQLLHGVPIDQTETARDVRTPIVTADVAEIVTAGTDLRVARVEAPSRTAGSAPDVREALAAAVTAGVDVIVCDAETEADIGLIATAAKAVLAAVEPLRWVAVDPGPFTVELARALRVPAIRASYPTLAVSGSATDLTRRQLRQLITQRRARVIRLRVEAGGDLRDIEGTSRALAGALAEAAGGEVVLLTTALDATDIADVGDGAHALASSIGRLVSSAIASAPVSGLYASGGDIATAVISELRGSGLEVTHELAPLAVAGTVVGGPWHGLPMVTKGGLVGDDTAVTSCIDHLMRDPRSHTGTVSFDDSLSTQKELT